MNSPIHPLTSASVALAAALAADKRCADAETLARANMQFATRELLFKQQDLERARAAQGLRLAGEPVPDDVPTTAAAYAAASKAQDDLAEASATVTALSRRRGDTLAQITRAESNQRAARTVAADALFPAAVAKYHEAAQALAQAASEMCGLGFLVPRLAGEMSSMAHLKIPAFGSMPTCDGAVTFADTVSVRGAPANAALLALHRQFDALEKMATAPDDDAMPVEKDPKRAAAAAKGHADRMARQAAEAAQ